MNEEKKEFKKIIVIGDELDPYYAYKYKRFAIVKDGKLEVMEINRENLEKFKLKTVVREEFIEPLMQLQEKIRRTSFTDFVLNYKDEYDIYIIHYRYGFGKVVELGAIPTTFDEVVSIAPKSEIGRIWPLLEKIEENLELQKEEDE